MKLCFFNDDRLGAVVGERVVDLSPVFPRSCRTSSQARLRHLIGNWEDVRPLCAALAAEQRGYPLTAVRLRAPVPRPSKVIAAPVNYIAHKEEVDWTVVEHTVEKLGFFLKSPTSVIGPCDRIRLPYPDRRTDYEGELAAVIGRRAHRVAAEQAQAHVFGYVCLLDISLRGPEDRSTRKSFDTFTPVGPWIATADEIPQPGALRLQTWLNGERRQDASTADMILGVAELVARASHVMPLDPGDLLATGTPAGVGQIRAGDVITVEIERIGRMSVDVGGDA